MISLISYLLFFIAYCFLGVCVGKIYRWLIPKNSGSGWDLDAGFLVLAWPFIVAAWLGIIGFLILATPFVLISKVCETVIEGKG